MNEMKKTVYLRKIGTAADVDEISTEISRGLKTFPDVLEQIKKSKRIALKPNVTGAHGAEKGRTTHPSVVAATIEAIRGISKAELIIADSAVVGLNTEEAFLETGILDVGNAHSVELLDINKGQFSVMEVRDAVLFENIEVSAILQDVDTIINMPKLKTNYGCKVGLGIKNLKGLISERYKKLFHLKGLQEGLCDLYGTVRCDFTIVDGILGSELNKAKTGEVLFMSDDVLCADFIGCLVMGIDPSEVEYINWLFTREFGPIADWNRYVDIAGDRIENCVSRFRYVGDQYTEIIPFENVSIIDHSPCSGCIGTVESGFDKLGRLGYPKDCLSGVTILTGSSLEKGLGIDDNATTDHGISVAVGNCISRYVKNENYHVIEGCPPTKGDFVAFFKDYIETK